MSAKLNLPISGSKMARYITKKPNKLLRVAETWARDLDIHYITLFCEESVRIKDIIISGNCSYTVLKVFEKLSATTVNGDVIWQYKLRCRFKNNYKFSYAK